MRQIKHRLTGGLAVWLGRYMGPMAITLVAFGIGMAAALAAALAYPLTALGLWLLNRFLDGLDGEVARAHGQASDFGGYVDMMCDVVIYAAIPLAVAWARADHGVTAAMLLMVAAFYANITSWSYLSALIEKRRSATTGSLDTHVTSIVMPHGLMEGTETIVVYGLLLAIPAIARETALVAAAAGVFSTAQRIVWATRSLRK